MWQRLFMPVRFKKIDKHLKDKPFRLLDIGCGNHSPSEAKKYFPRCEYHGVDKEEYNLNAEDRRKMDRFYRVDLDRDFLSQVPNDHFDVIVMAHVLEHLEHPLQVLEAVSHKLKRGGTLYLEFPSLNSLGLPSREGTLQFCDDASHIYLPNPYEITNALLKQNIRIQAASIRKDRLRFLSSPLFGLRNLIRKMLGKRPQSKGLWDFWGFAFYIQAVKIGK